MRKLLWMSVCALSLLMLVSGCALKQAPPPPFKACSIPMAGYTQKVDNFMVILDKSGSMRGRMGECNKLATAVSTLRKMNQTIPELKLTAGLRTFGSKCPVTKKTTLEYGVAPYVKKDLCESLAKITRAGGPSPMDMAILAAADDLAQTTGDIAVIIVSDADNMGAAPLEAAKELKQRFQDRVCIYTILIGDDKGGSALMKAMADAGSCGFTVNARDISSSQGMADFVTQVFLEKGDVPDSDGDGVLNPDDKCPGTPKGAEVNKVGCWVIKDLQFDFNKSEILPQFYPSLDKVVEILNLNPDLKVTVDGHTCNMGPKEYNYTLSKNRAKAAVDYFVGKGVDASRLESKGYGPDKPVTSNDTKQGRKRNRRVELTPVQ